MTVTIIRKSVPPRLTAAALHDTPGAEDLLALITLLKSEDPVQRYRARRLLRMHLQVMSMVDARKRAVAYIEQELADYPSSHPKPEGSS